MMGGRVRCDYEPGHEEQPKLPSENKAEERSI